MHSQTRIAILGAGVIGRRHVVWLRDQPRCIVSGIADPADAARAYCASEDIPWFADYRDLLNTKPDDVIVATPNDLHLPMGLECLGRGLPMLIEKPVADTVAAATEFANAEAASAMPVLVG